jgi:hypothetical protein
MPLAPIVRLAVTDTQDEKSPERKRSTTLQNPKTYPFNPRDPRNPRAIFLPFPLLEVQSTARLRVKPELGYVL